MCPEDQIPWPAPWPPQLTLGYFHGSLGLHRMFFEKQLLNQKRKRRRIQDWVAEDYA